MTAAAPVGSLWRHGDFRRYWGGQAVTVTGFGITTTGASVIAVVDLHASTMHVALIAVSGKLPQLLLSLHAGVRDLGTWFGVRTASPTVPGSRLLRCWCCGTCGMPPGDRPVQRRARSGWRER
ncbi:MFS transporter [Streptomyces sp. NBC_00996]|uniref:MFS transporter n=1 Tax=Streptomyces sp. NBC_00996 TaxID=2903710 RepID=UPI00386A441E|nr:MFS transporter [Streptomyces sp. NBC_00996]